MGVMVMREMATKRSRGFAFLTFPSQKDMDRAISDLHNTRIHGRLVTVTKARPFERPRDRSPRRWESPDRRHHHRRHDYGEKYYSNRRGYQDRSNMYHHPSEINPRYGLVLLECVEGWYRDDFGHRYVGRRGRGDDSYEGGYYNQRSEERRPSSERGLYFDDRRSARHSSSSHQEGRRQRWRSRERPSEGTHSYSDNRRRHYSPPPPVDPSPRRHVSARHHDEVRRTERYERD